jgi:DNA polymerase (family 10)
MTNREIALNLGQIASILEILDPNKNRFRILAYQKSVQTIENLTSELKDIYAQGGLKALNDIDGVGESIASTIEELLKTGKLAYLTELKKEVPVSELEFLKIPGVGPKMAVKIAKELKAKNITDLKKKIEAGKAGNVFKEKTASNLLRGIEIMSKLTGKLLIVEALPIAEEAVKFIKEFPETIQANYVGSLRRKKELIGDIDIVATSRNSEELINAFVKLPFVDHIVTQGKNKSTIIHAAGVQIDLEIVPEAEYGSLLQHFTGSKEHNVALRTYAQTQNKSVSEHGIKYQNELHTFKTEQGVYEFLGMDFIETELREDRGEIQAALAHNLPKLLELKDIKGDFHVHSNWSDGANSIEEMASYAEKMGYEYIAITDHTIGLGIANGLDEKRILAREKEIEKARSRHKIKIFSGVEVNIKADGTLDIRDEVLSKLDIVIGSIHTSFNQSKDVMTARLVKTIENPHVDIIGHPSGRILGQREACDIDWEKVFESAAKNNTVLEISASPYRLDLADYLVQIARKYGVKFAINTDAHKANQLELMNYGVAVARRGWCDKGDIVNTQNLEQVVKWLKLR